MCACVCESIPVDEELRMSRECIQLCLVFSHEVFAGVVPTALRKFFFFQASENFFPPCLPTVTRGNAKLWGSIVFS